VAHRGRAVSEGKFRRRMLAPARRQRRERKREKRKTVKGEERENRRM